MNQNKASKQDETDRLLNDIATSLRCSRTSLPILVVLKGVASSSKNEVAFQLIVPRSETMEKKSLFPSALLWKSRTNVQNSFLWLKKTPRLKVELCLPFLGLVDGDVYGVPILSVYRYG
ncbi:Spo11/DNA topoisomerase VI subunit A [Trema orientale]|uniref:Spo11/DNA topoisomerase VI subunit A n=1 Tax=Trema orientale TaxID=63057 RepID=A0A2P5FLV2_TREOI|nr:Spo11/DNA topoisomerase VI subunit A [Trema orientale]